MVSDMSEVQEVPSICMLASDMSVQCEIMRVRRECPNFDASISTVSSSIDGIEPMSKKRSAVQCRAKEANARRLKFVQPCSARNCSEWPAVCASLSITWSVRFVRYDKSNDPKFGHSVGNASRQRVEMLAHLRIPSR